MKEEKTILNFYILFIMATSNSKFCREKRILKN